ncbi:bile acid:sodium symporter [Nitzschia inconspicua]|uniref:Bile acid:sodium symporter n=1 Tax=Nitzschia inconspicua TaxID=303405 RepID=A0A9K3KVK9_9STRA|nr:bile acid:sodium symporter [Nitzschia inconspicua]
MFRCNFPLLFLATVCYVVNDLTTTTSVEAFAFKSTIQRLRYHTLTVKKSADMIRSNLFSLRAGADADPIVVPNIQRIRMRSKRSLLSLRSGADATVPEDANAATPKASSILSTANKFFDKNFFLVGMLASVLIAKGFPALGKNGGVLRPELFIGDYGVTAIFLLSGMSLQTSELTHAISNFKLNGLVQFLTFVVWPFCIGLPLKFLLTSVFPDVIPSALVDGLLILTTLPTTVNMCIMLTSTSGGNTASSICNVVISNLLGIFVTPLLLLRFFGATIQLPFANMVLKLCQKVLLPVTIGQLLRATGAKTFYQKHSSTFKRLQEVVLLGIVWNAFCNAFSDGLGIGVKETLFLLIFLPSLHLASLGASFKFFSLPALNFSRADTVAAMFCASQKTLAFGLPLVNTIFQGNPNLAAYCAPIMFIHPLQMMIGSFLVPAIQWYTARDNQ